MAGSLTLRCDVLWLLVALFAATSGVRADDASADNDRPLVPLPTTVPAPEDNPTTPEKVALGKQLFFDPRLSGENTRSCATCHLPEKAFADGRARSEGLDGKPLARNTPSLLNVAFQSTLFWDGRAKSLEEQALIPIQHPQEMNENLDALEQELSGVPEYAEEFQAVFGTGVTRESIAKALAAFQRTLVTGPSAFDRYLEGDEDALSAEAEHGLELFQGDAGCVRCHNGPLLADGEFYRLGVSFSDPGRAAATGNDDDRRKFRTPSLRNVAETAPYMHDGSKRTLDQVVEFYLRGAPTGTSGSLPPDIDPLLGLSYSEIRALVAFLESLTGEPPEITPPDLP
jgi:cytochrome c peroxidase